MSFKDRFNASKNRAEQKAEAKRQKQEAKQKAAEEKEQKKLEDPKYRAKVERKAEKARIAEEKRLVKIDKTFTEIFNRLMNDDGAALKAVEKYDGVLTQKIGGFNTIGEYFKKGGGLFIDNLGEITTQQIQENKAFKQYKDYMDKEGFDINIVRAWSSHDAYDTNTWKAFTGTSAAFFFTVTAAAPVFAPVSLIGIAGLASNNASAAEFSLEIKEKVPVNTAETLTEGEDLLEQLNKEQFKQPEKVPVKQRNIIR